MKTMKDYLQAYILSDVLLLTDASSCFRKQMLEDFKLYPLHYFSLSGYSFDAALRFSDVKLELLCDLEMSYCIESGIRGGLAFIGSPRYARANYPDMPDNEYDPTKPVSRIEFYDVTGLYTSIMKGNKLPTFGFRWLSEWGIERFDVMAIPADSDKGYICDVDLHVPEATHDVLDQMPPACERTRVSADDLSEYSRYLAAECGIGLEHLADMEKLCLTLRDKKRYVAYYSNIQLYLKLGLVLEKLHRVIEFTQSDWLHDFMAFVAKKRKNSKSKLYNTIYKAIPNNVYGKLLENVRRHKSIRIVTESTCRQRSGKGAIRKRLRLQKPRWEKPNLQSGTYTMKTFRKPNEQLFSQ